MHHFSKLFCTLLSKKVAVTPDLCWCGVTATSPFCNKLCNCSFKLGVCASLRSAEWSSVTACSLQRLIFTPFSPTRLINVVAVVVLACHAVSILFGSEFDGSAEWQLVSCSLRKQNKDHYPRKRKREEMKVPKRDRRRGTQGNVSLQFCVNCRETALLAEICV